MPDIQKTRELQYKVMQDIAAGALIPMMRIGDELRLFEKLYKFGPCSSDNFSVKIKMDKRYIREWLLALSAASYINYNPETEEFSLSDEQYSVLGDEDSISLMIGGFENLTGAIHNVDKIKENFLNGKGTDWGSLHPCCLSGSARFFKPAYSIFLIKKWIPSLEGAEEILASGGAIADIGCGHGFSTSLIAETYKNAKVVGIDPHKPSIDEAKKYNGNLENLQFKVGSAKDFDGRVYWMGTANFYVFDGTVKNLPCTVRRFVFDDINLDQSDKIFAGVNSQFKEITWLYCSKDSTECDRYVTFNPNENYWVYGSTHFTTFEDKGVFSNTVTTGVETSSSLSYLYDNEPEGIYTANGNGIESFVESADFDMSQGNEIMFIDRMVPDFTLSNEVSGTSGQLNVQFTTKRYPDANESTTKGPFIIQPNTEKILLSQRKQIKYKVLVFTFYLPMAGKFTLIFLRIIQIHHPDFTLLNFKRAVIKRSIIK